MLQTIHLKLNALEKCGTAGSSVVKKDEEEQHKIKQLLNYILRD